MPKAAHPLPATDDRLFGPEAYIENPTPEQVANTRRAERGLMEWAERRAEREAGRPKDAA